MNSKLLVSVVALLVGISSVAYALDFGNVRTMFYKAKYAEFLFFTPFEGEGRPSTIPDWFNLTKFNETKSVVNGFLYHSQEDTFRQRIYIKINGNLDINGTVKKTDFKFWSTMNEADCQVFNDQSILCFSEGGKLKINRAGYRWSGEVNNYSVEINDEGVGFKNLTLTGYENSTELFKINVVEDYFKFNYFYVPKTRAVFELDGGNVDYMIRPENSNLNFPFDMSNYTQVQNWGGGKIIKGGGFLGSVQLVFTGNLTGEGLPGQFDGGAALRTDISTYLVEKSFSDCPVFNSTDLYCKIRFGYMHTYFPVHEDQTIWKTYFNLMILNITGGKATVTAGVHNATDLFQISDMNVSKLQVS